MLMDHRWSMIFRVALRACHILTLMFITVQGLSKKMCIFYWSPERLAHRWLQVKMTAGWLWNAQRTDDRHLRINMRTKKIKPSPARRHFFKKII